MAYVFRKRGKKTGLPPGSLVHVGSKISEKIKISLFDYNESHFVEKIDVSVDECLVYLGTPSVTWINVHGISDPHVMETLGRNFGLHGLLLEDIMNSGQRTKLDNYKDNIYIVMRMLQLDPKSLKIDDEQISVILGSNYVITFFENGRDIFEPIRERIRKGNNRIRKMKADYLCYAIIDTVVDHYFVILEAEDKKLEDLEEALTNDPNPAIMHKIQRIKREIILLRKAIWPMREVVNQFCKLETPLIQNTTLVYMRDVYDHTIQTIDTIESFRDIASGLLDVYLSNISQRLNEIMKVLTVVSTIFVPMTFIASLYGMNFQYMPELQWPWGYPFALSIMICTALAMLFFFRRKKWI